MQEPQQEGQEASFDETFDIGAFDSHTAEEDTDFPTLPASKRVTTTVDGEKVRKHDPIYLCTISGAKVRPNRWRETENDLALQFKTVLPIPGTKLKATVFEDIPKFQTPESVREEVAMDDDILVDDKEETVTRRLGAIARQKARVESLIKAIEPMRLLDLLTAGSDVSVGVAVRVGEKTDGGKFNKAVKFYPASEATDTEEQVD